MNNLVIRTVKDGDLKSIYLIERLSFERPYPSSYLETLAYLSPETFLVVSLNGSIVGYSASVLRGSEGHIISIAVHPDYRGIGIGEKLLRENIKRLKDSGAKRVVLEVRIDNIQALKLYQKLGFKIVKTLKNYYWDGADAYKMVLNV
ncbi:MAG: ribosomal protein S18-alanine N-acetyltransferase [Candidatus Bathyarchaeia archaeon]